MGTDACLIIEMKESVAARVSLCWVLVILSARLPRSHLPVGASCPSCRFISEEEVLLPVLSGKILSSLLLISTNMMCLRIRSHKFFSSDETVQPTASKFPSFNKNFGRFKLD